MRSLLAIGVAWTLVPLSGMAQQAQRPSIDSAYAALARVRRFREVAISSDGKWVAWVETLAVVGDAPSAGTAIYVAPAGVAGVAHRIRARAGDAPSDDHGIAWSPDNKSLAFLSDAAASGQLQLYTVPAAGGAAAQLTHVTGYLAAPRWAPDGHSIALLFTQNAPRSAGPLQPRTPDVGVVEDKYYEQRLTTVDLGTRRVRQLTPPDLYVYEYDWAPDGRRLIATSAHGEGDDNWYVAQLWVVDAASGETTSILRTDLQIAVPRWSPDGTQIAFIGGTMSDEGIAAGDIYTIAPTGGQPRNITAAMKASAYWITWAGGSRRVLWAGAVDGQSAVGTVDASGGAVQVLWTGAEKIHGEGDYDFGIAVASDAKTTAVVRESYAHPPEVWAGAIGAWRQVTDDNHGAEALWGEGKSLHWKSDDLTVQGWVVYPKSYDPGRKYPMVVWIHGGPAWVTSPSWPGTFDNATILASRGYFVFYPNPRGSMSQGEAFTRANIKDFGGGDLRNILAGVENIVHTLPLDSTRVGITGWSYGGFMTMWALTQTNRFRAGVSGAGLANWLSYYGENGIDQWMIPYFGASVYDDPAVYAKSSPINFIKNVKTPTLIVVGDRDIECPPPQSYEYWHALRTLGVKTEFVIYPDEGHDIGKPADRRDIIRRMAAWFDGNMPPTVE